MDKFEEMMQKMTAMSAEERRTFDEENRKRCICPGCPTYNDCMRGKNERMFCVAGKSSCEVTQQGCICPTCPVTAILGLTHTFCCTDGSEKQRRGM